MFYNGSKSGEPQASAFESMRIHCEFPDRTNMEFVKDIDAELKRRNDGPSIPHNRILNKPQQEKKPNGSEY